MIRQMRERSGQQGLTMIELLVVLAISSLLVTALVGIYQVRAEGQREDAAAEHAKRVISAVQEYTRDNFSTIVAGAGPSTPYTVTSAQLSSGGYLPAGTSTNNAFQQGFVVKIIEPSANKVEGMVLYTGGQTLSTGTLRSIANKIGLAGGYVATSDTGTAHGMMNAWSKALAPFGGNQGTGKVALSVFAADAMQVDDYLHRSSTSGKPELNRMSTAIDMAGNDLSSAGTVAATNVDASNGIKANSISIGKSSFGTNPYPYETIQLNSGFNMRFTIGTREHTVLGNDGTLTTHGNITSEGNVLATGGVTAQGTVHANGNVTAGGSMSAGSSIAAGGNVSGTEVYARNWFRSQGNGGWYSEPYGGGFYMSDSTWIRAYNNKNIYTGGQVRGGSMQADGTLSVGGRATMGEFIQLNGTAGEGGGCSPNGLIGRTSAGKILSCESGKWTGGGGIKGSLIVTGGQSQGPQWAYATCPAGTYIAGGGYNIVYMQKSSSQEAPQITRPDGNGWVIWSGSSSGAQESRFQSYAVCTY